MFWTLVLLPILLMAIVNGVHQTPPTGYLEDKCSRYCHNITCKHAIEKQGTEKPMTKFTLRLYEKNIALLKENKLGLTYKEINLLIYVVVFPILSGVMLWGVLRKSRS